MIRTLTPTIILAMTANTPLIASELPIDGMPHLVLTSLDMSPTANTLIGVDNTGRVIAIITTDDGEITEVGLAPCDFDDDMMIFGKAEIFEDYGQLHIQMAESGGALMVGDKALDFDPRTVALAIQRTGIGGTSLPNIAAKIEGEGRNATLIFSADIGTDTAVEATLVVVADQPFMVATVGDHVIVVAVTKAGRSWCASGTIGSVRNDETIADMMPADLADNDFGRLTGAEVAFATSRHGQLAAALAAA